MKIRKRFFMIILLLAALVAGCILLYSNLYPTEYSFIKKRKQYYDPNEYKLHNDSLERSPYFKRILPEVMKEVYRIYAEEEIKHEEEHLLRMNEDSDSFYSHDDREKIMEAKRLLKDAPEQAAKLYFRMGTCQELWAIQKNILKEKYGITWYTPAELNPDNKYD